MAPPKPPLFGQEASVKALVRQTAELLGALCDHPLFNKSAPVSSPKQLWYTADFVRRTLLEYIDPLLEPAIRDGSLLSKANKEKWTDSLSRSVLIASIILEDDQQILCGGKFDFGDNVREKARALLKDEEIDEGADDDGWVTEEEVEGAEGPAN